MLVRIVAVLGAALGLAATATAAQVTQPQLTAQPTLRADQLRADQLRVGPSMEGLSAAAVRLEVRNSPLFVAELDPARLTAGGPVAIELQAGVELDLNAYLTGSRLLARPGLAALQSEPEALGLIGPVRVREEVFLLEDRIVVSREAEMRVSARTCREGADGAGQVRRPRGPMAQLQSAARERVERARAELCLSPPQARPQQGALSPVVLDPGTALTPAMRTRVQTVEGGARLLLPPTQADIAEAAEEVRSELRTMNRQAEFRHGVSVAQALAMPDAELIALDMDGEERIISHVSIIPLAPRAGVSIGGAPDLTAPPAPPADFGRGFTLDRAIGPRLQAIPSTLAPFVLRRADLMPNPRIRTVPPGALTLRPDAAGSGGGAAMQAVPRLETLQMAPGLARLPGTAPAPREPVRRTSVTQTADHYFITGFTLSDQIEERYKHTFNQRRNYFVAFQYSVGYRAGLRFPFHVRTRSDTFFSEDPATRRWRATESTVRISAAGRQTTVNGGSIYQASGMPRELWFDDREFTIGVWAGCQLQVRAPVVGTVRINCPSVSIPRAGTCPNWACADFDPPIGRRTLLASPRLPADVTGLQINAWIARAGVEPGVNVYAADARFLMDAEARGSRFVTDPGQSYACRPANRSDPASDNQLINDRLCRVAVTRSPMENREMVLRLISTNEHAPGVILRNPAYEFALEFVPVLGLFAVIDIAVASWRFDRDIEIRGLTIRREFRFTRHAGTTESAEVGLCGPDDRSAPGCTSRLGYQFGRIWVDDGGPG
jgi:hypothetical protein